MNKNHWLNVATETGMAKNTFYRRKRKGMSDEQAATTPLSNRGRPTGSVKEYAVYRGDDLIVMGTATECAEFLGVKKHTIYWYASPSAKKQSNKSD